MSHPIDRLSEGSTRTSALPDNLHERITRLVDLDAPRYRRLWNYYRNPLLPSAETLTSAGSVRPYRMAQEWGLPSRITGMASGSADLVSAQPADGVARKEVVVENDIAWRVDTLVDDPFGKPIVISSSAPDPMRRASVEFLLRAVIAHNGGIVFLQQLALLGAVYGFVDVLVKFDPHPSEPRARSGSDGATLDRALRNVADKGTNEPSSDGAGPSQREASAAPSVEADRPPVPPSAEPAPGQPDPSADTDPSRGAPARVDTVPAGPVLDEARLTRIARCIRLEIVEPARALPLLDPNDWRVVNAYAQVYCVSRKSNGSTVLGAPSSTRSWLDRFLSRFAANRSPVLRSRASSDEALVVDLITPTNWQRFENERLVARGDNMLGRIPLVHIQNNAVPFEYAGTSDVEPLLPLQDELNTRLSDRANRITLQSFKMYLGKGIENFGQLPVAPGRMWMTDNEQAEVVEFGGDSGCPSEAAHISDIREALDKTSAVTPIAAGAIKGRIGRLTSAAALRVTLLALLAKTERKRTTYGAGIEHICELALAWLDVAGLFRTEPDERGIKINWPSPIPENDAERLDEAEAKLRIGIDRKIVLRELGY